MNMDRIGVHHRLAHKNAETLPGKCNTHVVSGNSRSAFAAQCNTSFTYIHRHTLSGNLTA